MAFTDPQIAQVLQILGLQFTSENESRVSDALDAIDAVTNAELETRVQNLLSSIQTFDEQIAKGTEVPHTVHYATNYLHNYRNAKLLGELIGVSASKEAYPRDFLDQLRNFSSPIQTSLIELPLEDATTGDLEINASITITSFQGQPATGTIVITNASASAITVNGATLAGDDVFSITSAPSYPVSIAAQDQQSWTITFNPNNSTTAGYTPQAVFTAIAANNDVLKVTITGVVDTATTGDLDIFAPVSLNTYNGASKLFDIIVINQSASAIDIEAADVAGSSEFSLGVKVYPVTIGAYGLEVFTVTITLAVNSLTATLIEPFTFVAIADNGDILNATVSVTDLNII